MDPYKLQILRVEPLQNYYRVVFRESGNGSVCKTPAWALGAAESVSKGSKIVTCILDGKWKIQSVLITRKFHDAKDARRLGLQIAQKIERSDKEIPKNWAGGRVEGPSHDEGGVIVELEGREGVLMVAVMDDPAPKVYSGTNREIVNQMQLEHGGNPMMANGGTLKPAEAWIELSYIDADGIDWAKDRLTEDKVKSVFQDADINCLSGNCPSGSGITLNTGERDIVFYIPVAQREKAVEAIKLEMKNLNIPPKEMKVKSGIAEMKKGGKVWIQEAEKKMKENKTEGKFTRKARRHQMLPIPYAKQVLAHPERHTLTTRREAQFLMNLQSN